MCAKLEAGCFRYNIMVKGYREHAKVPEPYNICQQSADDYENLRKNVVTAMFQGLIKPDERVQKWVDKQNKITDISLLDISYLHKRLLKFYNDTNKKTINKAEKHFEFFISFFGEKRKLLSITKSDIEIDMYNKLKERKNKLNQPISDATVNRYVSTLRKAFNVLRDDDKLNFNYNPCDGIKKRKEISSKKKLILPLSLQEKFLAALPEMQRDMVELDINTGLRIDNIMKLNKSQIDLNERIIHILPEDNKGKKDMKIRINKTALKIILKYYESAEFYLFTHKKGKYKGRPFNSIRKSFKTAAIAIGMPELTPHDIRRTFGTRIYKITGDIDIARKALYHSSWETARSYIITDDSEVDTSIDKLDDLPTQRTNINPKLKYLKKFSISRFVA